MSCKDLNSLADNELKDFFNSFDLVFCDCDGVVLINQKVLSKVPQSINALINIGKRVVFVTNNTSVSRAVLLEIFLNSGMDNIEEDNFITPAVAISSYFEEIGFSEKVYVIGLPGLREDLSKRGVAIANNHLILLNEYTVGALQEKLNTCDEEVGAVIICLDFNMTLLSLNQAINYLQDPKVKFLITGNDKTIIWAPTKIRKQICLGAGYIQDVVKFASKREPIGFGKPLEGFATYLLNFMKENEYDANRILFIGDSLEQDVSFAKKLGNKQLLVLSGNTTMEDLENCDNDQKPDYYIKDMTKLKSLIDKVYITNKYF